MTAVDDSVLAAMASASNEVEQVVALLQAAGVADPMQLPIGTGDRLLLALAKLLLPDGLEFVVICPDCAAANSAVLDVSSFPPAAPRSAWWGPGGGLREPTYADLIDLPGGVAAAEAELLARCTIGTPSRPATAADLALIDDALTGPLALACVACGRALEAGVDVELAILERLAARAEEVDLEIHLIASAYQWELATIERLPDQRRRRLARFVAEAR